MMDDGDIEISTVPGDLSPELVPVTPADALGLALPPAGAAASSEIALGDLLSEALFGEVIDISELIPQVLSPDVGAALSLGAGAAGTAETGQPGAGDAVADASQAADTLTILYDDDILASDGAIF